MIDGKQIKNKSLDASRLSYPGQPGYTLFSDQSTNGIIWASSKDGFRNKIINGAFDVWQNGTAAVNTGVTGKPDRVDRFVVYHSSDGTVTHQQASPSLLTPTVTGGTKVQYASQLSVTVADGTLTGDQRLLMYQAIEGYNSRTIAATGFAFSFWMYGPAGTYSAFAGDNTYYNVQHFTLPNNTWTRITVTFQPNPNYAGSTTNGVGIIVGVTLALASGSTYATSTLGTWQNAGKLGSTTQTNGLASNTNIFYTTLWQVEEGLVTTRFEERSVQQELVLCHRYCRVYGLNATSSYMATGVAIASNRALIVVPNNVSMRIREPSFSYSSVSDLFFYDGTGNPTANGTPTPSVSGSTEFGIGLDIYTNVATLTTGRGVYMYVAGSTSKYCKFEAEF